MVVNLTDNAFTSVGIWRKSAVFTSLEYQLTSDKKCSFLPDDTVTIVALYSTSFQMKRFKQSIQLDYRDNFTSNFIARFFLHAKILVHLINMYLNCRCSLTSHKCFLAKIRFV
jgi:hypothetical protein